MKIVIYHGSKNIIENPTYGKGKKYNDYGLGFYCTQSEDLSKEWAVSETEDGFSNCYSLDMDNLTLLNLNSPDFCILHWLTVLVQNRQFDIQSDFGEEALFYLMKYFNVNYEEYDLIKGYRADDSYFSFASDFLNNIISLSTLDEAMRLGKLGEQIVLKSPKAFECIEFRKAELADKEIWFNKKSVRDTQARIQYKNIRSRSWQRGEIYMMQILENQLRPDFFISKNNR